MKQVIIVRKDLKMGKGKIAAQVAHASLESFLKSRKNFREKWKREGCKKIVLKANLKEILDVYKKLKKEGIACYLVRDSGLTQLKKGTITCLGIGPLEDEIIDKFTKKFKLL